MSRVLGRLSSGAGSPLPRAWRERSTGQDEASDARAEAARILFEARVRARTLAAEAKAAADAAIAGELRQARERGYADGLELARREQLHIVERLDTLVSASRAAHAENAQQLDQMALTLAIALARMVVRRELVSVPETLIDVTRAALAEMAVEAEVSLRVHPDDVPLLRDRLPELGLGSLLAVAVVGDPGLSQGSCVIRSGPGEVDASVDTQMARAERLLRDQISVD
ncbi:MAG: FliH/SctL family protein [Chloroflexota bacterium]